MSAKRKGIIFDEDLISDVQGELHGFDSEEDALNYDLTWRPSLNPAQKRCFDCQTPYVLAYGERASGKTVGFCHKVIDHLVNNFNALAVLIVRVRSMATEGGLWEKMEVDILPQWKTGMGLIYSEERMNESRMRYRFVKNKFGGWSKMVLLSLEHGEQLKGKIRGFEPSIVFIDELTTLKDKAFFTAVIQQLGRRPHIHSVQQYLAATNPEGPSHWVYKQWFEFPEGTTKEKDRYEAIHIPIKENKHNLPEDYYNTVMEACANDPVEYRRLVLGEWVDRPTGEAMFRDAYNERRHIRGRGIERILPDPNFPVIIGYDLGSANNAIIFMQQLPFPDRTVWMIFDELVWLNHKIMFENIVPLLLKRMMFWNSAVGRELSWEHISDDSALNQWRQTTGSYDAMEIERLSEVFKKQYPDIPSIRLKGAPKFKGSVERRGRLLHQLFLKDEIVISHACVQTLDMVMNLEGENDNFFQRKHNRYSHVFDALTYPIINYSVSGGVAQRPEDNTMEMVVMDY